MDTAMQEYARLVCGAADWEWPGLQSSAAIRVFANNDRHAAAVKLIGHLRQRSRPVTGYTPAFVRKLRAAATPETLAAAAARIDEALAFDPAKTNRGPAAIHLGAETLILGITPERFQKLGLAVIASRPNWAIWERCTWGTAHAICLALRALWPLEECNDEDFIPLFAWLVEQVKAEWAWSKGWDEAMLGTQGHNWWLHAYGGLAQAGLLFPEFLGFAQFGAFLPDWLEHELQILMEADGFTRERSGYHWGTADEFFDLAHLARINGRPVSAAAQTHLEAIAEVNWKVITSDRDLIYVGDTGHRRPGTWVGRLRMDAAQFGIGEAKWVAQHLEPDWKPAKKEMMTWNGKDYLPDYEKLRPVAPLGPDTSLPQSGYYFMRQDWTAAADYVCIDAGARGNIVTSHDHAAVFHMLLNSRGRAILVDNYSGHYGNTPARLYRVGSAAHNTITIDGESSVPFENEWRWDDNVQPAVQEWKGTEDYAYFSGVHEGYSRMEHGVPSVRRKLFYLRGGYWILIDRLTAASREHRHSYDLHFHLAVPAQLDPDGRVTTQGAGGSGGTGGTGGNLVILPVEGARGAARLEPHPHPLDVFENPDHLSYKQEVTGHGLFVTLLVPFAGDRAPKVSAKLIDVRGDGRILTPWEVTGLEIEVDGRRDVYVDQHMEWNLPWNAGGLQGAGRLFHSRCGGKKVKKPTRKAAAKPAHAAGKKGAKPRKG